MMAVQRIYSCDLCGTGFKGSLLGLGFSYDSERGRDAIQAKYVGETERHICGRCLLDLRKIAESKAGRELIEGAKPDE